MARCFVFSSPHVVLPLSSSVFLPLFSFSWPLFLSFPYRSLLHVFLFLCVCFVLSFLRLQFLLSSFSYPSLVCPSLPLRSLIPFSCFSLMSPVCPPLITFPLLILSLSSCLSSPSLFVPSCLPLPLPLPSLRSSFYFLCLSFSSFPASCLSFPLQQLTSHSPKITLYLSPLPPPLPSI